VSALCIDIAFTALGIFHSPASIHQIGDKSMTPLFRDRRVDRTPQAARNLK
jgi:hypothetical protein